MILRDVAVLGKIQSRCDGVGSEVNGGKPSVNRALRGTSEGFAFGGKLTLVRLPSGGFEYRKREAGRAAFARPTERVLWRGPGTTPRLRTELFSPDWSGGSSSSIGFSRVVR